LPTQYVPFTQRAWHAGESVFDGRANCNDYSIGIELEGCDSRDFTQAQYETLTQITGAIMQYWPKITIKLQRTGSPDIVISRQTEKRIRDRRSIGMVIIYHYNFQASGSLNCFFIA